MAQIYLAASGTTVMLITPKDDNYHLFKLPAVFYFAAPGPDIESCFGFSQVCGMNLCGVSCLQVNKYDDLKNEPIYTEGMHSRQIAICENGTGIAEN